MERPKIIAIAACSIDGFIARADDELISWSSKEDKRLFAEETRKARVVIMGSRTFQTLPRPLDSRLNIILTSHTQDCTDIPGQLEFINLLPEQVAHELGRRNFQTAFVCGGARTYTEFLKMQLLDELWLTVEPVIFGKGIAIFNETVYGVANRLIDTRQLNRDTVHLRYQD